MKKRTSKITNRMLNSSHPNPDSQAFSRSSTTFDAPFPTSVQFQASMEVSSIHLPSAFHGWLSRVGHGSLKHMLETGCVRHQAFHHSLELSSHIEPSTPYGQSQLKSAYPYVASSSSAGRGGCWPLHSPPFWHGELPHSSISANKSTYLIHLDFFYILPLSLISKHIFFKYHFPSQLFHRRIDSIFHPNISISK